MSYALGPSVHVGTAGIALFLSRLYSVTREPKHADTALGAATHALRHAWVNQERSTNGQHPEMIGGSWRFGFHLGTLGVAWAGHVVAKATGVEEIEKQARALAGEVITRKSRLTEFDVSFGAAGGILTSLELSADGWNECAPLAERFGRFLAKSGYRRGDTYSWGPEAKDPTKKNAIGFSHGAAGAGFALAKLYGRTGDNAFRDAAMGAFNYERAFLDTERGDWRDPNVPGGAEANWVGNARWCGGAPGLGFARTLSIPHLKDERLGEDVRQATRTTAMYVEQGDALPGEQSTTCCGHMGQLEALMTMETYLNGTGSARARHLALAISRYGHKAREGSQGWIDWPTGAYYGTHPGLMQGMSGIGHLCLQVAKPALIPTSLIPESAPHIR